jgi:tripartite-type tricarboxylate transporter receptor subunit TctC
MRARAAWTAAMAAVAAVATVGGACAQSFPARAVRIVVAFPAGGPNDIIARALGLKLTDAWRQPVVVDNRPGASGIVGSELVARATPDGHTLMMGSITHAILPSLYAKLPFDPVKDFTPVSLAAVAPLLMVVHPSVPATSVKELIAHARSRPGKMSYASTGNGTSIHLYAEMFKSVAGLDIVHVPYKGSAPAMTDLVAGQVQMMIEAMPSALPQVRAGRIRALAVTGATRSTEVPNLPTVAEAGLPGFEATIWWGVLGPASIPRGPLDTLNAAINTALGTAEVRERLAAVGVEAAGTTSARFAEVIRRDVQRFAKVVADTGAKID